MLLTPAEASQLSGEHLASTARGPAARGQWSSPTGIDGQIRPGAGGRPGKPLWFGTAPLGATEPRTLVAGRIALGAPISFNAPLAAFIPVRVETLAGTDGVVELPPVPMTFRRDS
jgi:hypothetical protein